MTKLEKEAKNKEKIQEKVDREKKKLSEIERERNAIEERLNSTKRFDELNEDESRLKKLNEEDQAIIDDVNATESEKQDAEERIAERNASTRQRNASTRKSTRDLQKIWRYGSIDVSCCQHYNRSCCSGNHQRFKIHGQSIGK